MYTSIWNLRYDPGQASEASIAGNWLDLATYGRWPWLPAMGTLGALGTSALGAFQAARRLVGG